MSPAITSSSSSSSSTRLVALSAASRERQHLPAISRYAKPASTTSSTLFASSSSSPDDGNSKKNKRQMLQKAVQSLRKRLTSIATFPARFQARFRKLSKRARMLVVVQMLMFTIIFGSMGRKAYVTFNGGPGVNPRVPVELPYSSFLDLVEGSTGSVGSTGTSSNNAGSAANSKFSIPGQTSSISRPTVVMDNVRIGPDRVVYRLTKTQAESEVATAPDNNADGKNSNSNKSKQPQTITAYSYKVPASPELVDKLRSNDIPFTAMSQKRANTVSTLLRSSILAFYALILLRMYRSFSGNAGGGSGDTPGKLASSATMPLASFTDIQGIDNAKTEVMELVDTLRNPKKYAILGARAPTGLLLEGPPGTGKTMLARATAAAAGVPLLYCSGSDFVEMFVGRGASRVRKLFERATKLAPCIIFFDELDALGKARDSGTSFMGNRGNDEAEQTLNQLLACMDGLDSSRRICVLAATNRKEVLDPALVRPGRFDRIVKLELPNAKGRENILRVHASKLPGFQECSGVDDRRQGSLGKGDKIDLSAVASLTPGLSGAELEFLVNEAAIRAVRRVSAALQKGEEGITPHVKPEDFETSLQNFYATRKPQKGVGDIFKNVMGQ